MKGSVSILFLWLSIYAAKGETTSIQSSDEYKIDSVFSYNITVLERYLRDVKTDSTGASMRAVYILEHMTGITSSGRMTYIGKIGFEAEDLCKWRAWYTKNKGNLLWDPKYKVVRIKG